jgi:signal transduction histidine kinase
LSPSQLLAGEQAPNRVALLRLLVDETGSGVLGAVGVLATAGPVLDPALGPSELARRIHGLPPELRGDIAWRLRTVAERVSNLLHVQEGADALFERFRVLQVGGQPTSTVQTVEQVAQSAGALARSLRGLSAGWFDVEVAVGSIGNLKVLASPQLDDLFMNLLANAARAVAKSIHDPVIRVEAALVQSTGEIEFRVIDNGEPLPADLVDAPFRPRPMRPDGGGLGLISCFFLAQAAGGSIQFLADGGTKVFAVRIPVFRPPQDTDHDTHD